MDIWGTCTSIHAGQGGPTPSRASVFRIQSGFVSPFVKELKTKTPESPTLRNEPDPGEGVLIKIASQNTAAATLLVGSTEGI